MKQIAAVLAALVLLGGCVSAPKEGFIRPLELGREQQGLVDLLGQNGGTLLFEYDTVETFSAMDVWVEVYHNGEIEQPRAAALTMTEPAGKRWQGRLVVQITETPDILYNLSVREEAGGSYSTSSPPAIAHHGTTTRSYSGLEGLMPLELGRETALYAGVYTSRDTWAIYDPQEYIADPEKIADAEYLHLIKCRFRNDTA